MRGWTVSNDQRAYKHTLYTRVKAPNSKQLNIQWTTFWLRHEKLRRKSKPLAANPPPATGSPTRQAWNPQRGVSIITKTNKAAESATAPAPTAVAVDPFADVPVTKIGDDVSFQDFTDAPTTNPYKYANVHSAAAAERLPMRKDYKHGKAVIIQGTNRKEYSPGSVYGDIQRIGNAAGRAGTPVYVLLTQLRRAQIGNKRSKYCEQLPPIGWAEGWLDTAITKGIVGVHPTKTAPPLREEVAPAAAEPEAPEQKKIANG